MFNVCLTLHVATYLAWHEKLKMYIHDWGIHSRYNICQCKLETDNPAV